MRTEGENERDNECKIAGRTLWFILHNVGRGAAADEAKEFKFVKERAGSQSASSAAVTSGTTQPGPQVHVGQSSAMVCLTHQDLSFVCIVHFIIQHEAGISRSLVLVVRCSSRSPLRTREECR